WQDSSMEMRRGMGLLLVAALLSTRSLAAQDLTPQPEQGRPWVVGFSHYAKWGVLASAIAFTALSLRAHRDADQYFTGLKQFCAHANEECQVSPEGTYRSADAE